MPRGELLRFGKYLQEVNQTLYQAQLPGDSEVDSGSTTPVMPSGGVIYTDVKRRRYARYSIFVEQGRPTIDKITALTTYVNARGEDYACQEAPWYVLEGLVHFGPGMGIPVSPLRSETWVFLDMTVALANSILNRADALYCIAEADADNDGNYTRVAALPVLSKSRLNPRTILSYDTIPRITDEVRLAMKISNGGEQPPVTRQLALVAGEGGSTPEANLNWDFDSINRLQHGEPINTRIVITTENPATE